MLNTIGLTAEQDYHFWLEAVRNCKPRHVTTTPFCGDVPRTKVQVWVVAPHKTTNPASYRGWLCSLEAPIVLITQHTTAVLSLARVVPYLTFICHPLQAEYELHDLLCLASQRASGVAIVEASREWRETLRTVR